MDLQDLHAAFLVGWMDDDLPVESSRSKQSRIEDVWPVGGGQDDDAFMAGKAIHLGQDLIQGLFALVVTAESPRTAARAANRVDLIDEDDCWSDLPRLRKQLADPTGPDTDDHLDELRGAGAEERDLRLARGGPRQQRLPGTRSSGQQHTLRSAGAEATILFGILQEVDDLVDFRLDFVDTGDIVKRDANRFGIDALLLAAAQQSARHRPLLALEHPDVEANEQENRGKRNEQVRQEATLLDQRCRTHGGSVRPSARAARSSFANVGRSVVNC